MTLTAGPSRALLSCAENIIARSDPWPNLLNVIHKKTHEYIVRQELLIFEQQPWNPARVRESERNLRRLAILAAARLVPCHDPHDPEGIILLVVTKDLWSLRLNSSFSATGTTLHQLDLFPTETNFLGRNKSLGVHIGFSEQELFGPNRNFVVFGQRYIDPRIWGTRLQFSEAVDLFIEGDIPAAGEASNGALWQPQVASGSWGGIEATFSFGQPLYSLATQWAYSISASVVSRQIRAYRQNPADQPAPRGERTGLSLRAVELAAIDENGERITEAVPRAYDKNEINVTASVTRSFGLVQKHDLNWGITFNREQRTAPDGFNVFHPAIVDSYLRTVVPRSTTTVQLFAAYEARGTQYIRLRSIQTFATTEDYLLGHHINLSLRGGLDLNNADQSFLQGAASLAYRWSLAEQIITVALAGQLRYQPQLSTIDPAFSGSLANTWVGVSARYISSILWVGRVHGLVVQQTRHNDLDRNVATLGGDAVANAFLRPGHTSFYFSPDLANGGLRGYASNAFEGRNIFRVNLEYRTLPLNLWTFHAGAVVFYDGGSVYGGDDVQNAGASLPFRYYQSLGFGLRGQFPQFDRQSFRVDIGFPLSGDAGGIGTWFAASFGQVF